MRNAFADELTGLGAENNKLVLLSGDIGNKLFDKFKEICPERFLNCGVAEANMMSLAAGMALSGMRPIVYTIAQFITTRCYEQIKIDVCYHKLPVIIAGVGSGLSYAEGGATHQSCEDICILRALPNMSVICPGDAYEVRAALRAASQHDGPVYIRIGKKGEPLVHKKIPANFQIGKGLIIKEGSDDVCILGVGNMLPIALQAASELATKGASARVISLHTVKPLDDELLCEIFSKFRLIVTVEEHSLIGGAGAAIAEWVADHHSPLNTELLRIAIPDMFNYRTYHQNYARETYGLTPETIANKAIDALNKTHHYCPVKNCPTTF